MSSTDPLLPSPELIDRVVGIETAYTASRLKVLEELPGNPVGVRIRELGGGALALMARPCKEPLAHATNGRQHRFPAGANLTGHHRLDG